MDRNSWSSTVVCGVQAPAPIPRESLEELLDDEAKAKLDRFRAAASEDADEDADAGADVVTYACSMPDCEETIELDEDAETVPARLREPCSGCGKPRFFEPAE